MQTVVIATVVVYVLTALAQAMSVRGVCVHRPVLRSVIACALLLHAYVLYHGIDTSAGQNLSVMNILSLVTWLSSVLIIVASCYVPLTNLLLFTLPLAALFVLLAACFPGVNVLHTVADMPRLLHVLLSMLTFSVFCVAGLQALLLTWQDVCVRGKHAGSGLPLLPPLEVMENVLFQIIGVGFFLLSAVLISSLWFFYHSWVVILWGKVVLTLLGWLSFAVLLVGRYYYGWRGTLAIRYTASGLFFLLLCYLLLAISW